MSWLKEISPGLCQISVKAVPGARKSALAGLHGEDAVKIRIAASPFEGAANEALIQFLAKTLSLPRSGVVLLKGETSRHKILQIRCPARIVASLLLQS